MTIGDKAPDLLGVDQNGKEIHLSDYKGRKLVLYLFLSERHDFGLYCPGM